MFGSFYFCIYYAGNLFKKIYRELAVTKTDRVAFLRFVKNQNLYFAFAFSAFCLLSPIFAATLKYNIYPLMDKLFYAAPLMALLGLLYTFIKSNWVAKQDAGTNRMQEISKHIAEGAMA